MNDFLPRGIQPGYRDGYPTGRGNLIESAARRFRWIQNNAVRAPGATEGKEGSRGQRPCRDLSAAKVQLFVTPYRR